MTSLICVTFKTKFTETENRWVVARGRTEGEKNGEVWSKGTNFYFIGWINLGESNV